ncbi:MAG: DUF2520 domain-containing protein [Prevotellaceae bacterium]|jgi:predicted short-subunit dehydrogenase-like oxidoreductase (DUF2520 family)|nr:DUF2520 domain-containing protein [Prevotellaceae bacterium]
MEIKYIKDIVIIGSGNVATSLAITLHRLHYYNIIQIYSLHLEHAESLAGVIGSCYTADLASVFTRADLYVIAVPDNQIENVLKFMPVVQGIVVHTSGSIPLNIFKGYTECYGVLYPLQTFSKAKVINDFSSVPIFIEAVNLWVLDVLKEFAGHLSSKVFKINTQQRLSLHVAGVFACNFVNHLLAVASGIMEENKLNKAWLNPLIRETIEKALSVENPADVQTGPAIRHDMLTLNRHAGFLASHPAELEIYQMLSENILNNYNK